MRLSTLYPLLLTVAMVLFATSCKKERPVAPIDDEEGSYIGQSTDVSTLEYVTVSLPGVVLSEEEYEGALGQTPVGLVRIDENTLGFVVPPDVKQGKSKLQIKGVQVAALYYTVSEKKLDTSPENVIRPLLEKLAARKAGLSDSPAEANLKLNITSLTMMIEKASPEEHQQLARFYEINKEIFDSMLTFSGSIANEASAVAQMNSRGRNLFSTNSTFDEFVDYEHKKAMIELSAFTANVGGALMSGSVLIGSWLFLERVAKGPLDKFVGGLAVALTGVLTLSCVIDAAIHLYNFFKIKIMTVNHGVESVSLDYPYGSSPDYTSRYNPDITKFGSLTYADQRSGPSAKADKSKPALILANRRVELKFSLMMRSLIEEDRGTDNPHLTEFFAKYDKYNSMVEKINQFVVRVNKATPSARLSPIPVFLLPSVDQAKAFSVDAASFTNFRFSLDHPSLTLIGPVLDEKNQLLLQIDIKDTDLTPRIHTELTYEYEGLFHRKKGSIPIVVDQGPLVGRWTLQSSDLSWSYWSGKEEDKPSKPTADIFEQYMFKGSLRFTPTEMHFDSEDNTANHMYYQSYQLRGSDIAVNNGYVFNMGKDGTEMKYLSDGRIRLRKEYTFFEDETLTIRVYSIIHETHYKKNGL